MIRNELLDPSFGLVFLEQEIISNLGVLFVGTAQWRKGASAWQQAGSRVEVEAAWVAGQDRAAAAALLLQHIRPRIRCYLPLPLERPNWKYPLRMAKQSNQDAQGGQVPSNVFLRESNSSKEHRIFPELSSLAGKPGTSLETNGPLASTFRCATLLNRVTDTLFGDTPHTDMTAGAISDMQWLEDGSRWLKMSSSLRLFLPSFSRSLPCFAFHLFLPSLPPSHFLHSRVTQREHAKSSISSCYQLSTPHLQWYCGGCTVGCWHCLGCHGGTILGS